MSGTLASSPAGQAASRRLSDGGGTPPSQPPGRQRSTCIVAVAAIAAIAMLAPGELLELHPNGSPYRLLTCHFTHWTYEQLAWDALVFVALGIACARRNAKATHATLLASLVLIPIAVLAFAPDITAYRGLSGLASAMFALLLTLEWRRLTWPVMLFATLFAAKLGFEAITGGAVFANDMGDDVVAVPVAHLAGALVGVIGGLQQRRKHLLLAPLLLASCISARSQVPPQRVSGAMCKSADLTGEWTSRRTTQLGPAWVKLVLRPDCRFTMRMQLLFARVVEDGVYRVENNTLRFARSSSDTHWKFRRERNRLHLEEAPGEWHTYTLRRCASSWPCSSL